MSYSSSIAAVLLLSFDWYACVCMCGVTIGWCARFASLLLLFVVVVCWVADFRFAMLSPQHPVGNVFSRFWNLINCPP